MAKYSIPSFITYGPNRYGEQKPHIDFYTYDPRKFDMGDKVVVREETIEVEIPDDFDPRPQMVAQLTAEKQKVRAEFAARITELDTQINNLLALEMA